MHYLREKTYKVILINVTRIQNGVSDFLKAAYHRRQENGSFVFFFRKKKKGCYTLSMGAWGHFLR